jgi:hypothetical protein
MSTEPHPLDLPPSLTRDAAKPPVHTAAKAKRTAPTKSKKPAEVSKTPTAAPKGTAAVVTLKELCAELKIDPYEARVKLRAAVADKKIKHAPKSAWQWERGDDELKKVRALLKKD